MGVSDKTYHQAGSGSFQIYLWGLYCQCPELPKCVVGGWKHCRLVNIKVDFVIISEFTEKPCHCLKLLEIDWIKKTLNKL